MTPAGLDHVIGNAAIRTPFGASAAHGLDDVVSQTEIAQGAFGVGLDPPLAGTSGCRKAHPLQSLQPADGEAADPWMSMPSSFCSRLIVPLVFASVLC